MARVRIWILVTLNTVLVFLMLYLVNAAYAATPDAPSDLQVGGFPGGQIRIAWTDNATNETSFELERSVDNRLQYTLLTTLEADTTVYTDTTVAFNTTYWYRVRACNAEGCTAYSKESYNVSFAADAVPNLDERYLLFLINESRADPAADGYPDYEPLPPVMYNALMNYAAHSHSQAILNSDFNIGHCYPDPPESQPDVEFRCPSERARDVGYYGGLSENLIAADDGWQAAESDHRAFMSSEGHRGNILDPGAKEAGLGHTFDPNKGSVWHGQTTYTFTGWNPVTLPTLPSGIVVPYWGRRTTLFSFLVNFYGINGSEPTQAEVVIDGMAHTMSLRRGVPANGSYVFATTLLPGTHTYYFEFIYNNGQITRLPESGEYSGPDIEVGAAVLEVPGEYPTLAAALASARGDVIVRLAAGIFDETTPIGVPTPGIWIEGAGIDRTIIRGDGSGHVLDISVDALIRDLTITNGGLDYFESAIWNTAGHVEVRNCRLTGNNVGLFTWCFEPTCDAVVTVTNSILDHNIRAAVDSNEHGIHQLINNTIVANGTGVFFNNPASQLENSILVHNTSVGVVGNQTPLLRYNNIWGNGMNYENVGPGVGDISVDPQFENESGSDYRLRIDSPSLDAGNPDSDYNDRNGGRNDQGAYGGPEALPVVNTRAMAPVFTQGAFPVSWRGYASDGFQDFDVQYQIRDSTGWTNWLVRVTGNMAQFGPTEPVELIPGNIYCFRSRARDRLGRLESYSHQADACTFFGFGAFLPVVMTHP